jgi:hypothetical protein
VPHGCGASPGGVAQGPAGERGEGEARQREKGQEVNAKAMGPNVSPCSL